MLSTGPEQTLTTADLDVLLDCEQRDYSRVDRRTRVQVISLCTDGTGVRPNITTGWTEDVSTTGARLLVCGSVSDDRIWIRIPESDRRDKFIECRVMWRDNAREGCMKANRRCGVRFERILTRGEFDQVLSNGTSTGEALSPPRLSERDAD